MTTRRTPMNPMRKSLLLALATFTAAWTGILGCGGCRNSPAKPEVVVYTALDAEFSEPLLNAYEAEHDVDVRANYDVESTKTVGLVNRLIAEKQRPRCDLFWNNEILHTLRLRNLGLLQPFYPAGHEQLPDGFQATDATWYGFAARARVLLVNTDRVPAEEMPDSIQDLVDVRWRGQVAFAKPLFGTTATHAAVLYAEWGSQPARKFFQQLKENAQMLGGNRQVALAVGRGEVAFGLTDTDDALLEREAGRPVVIVFPDQGPEQSGTLLIPNTLALLKDCPHPEAGRKLAEYLLSAEVERKLAAGPSGQIPLRADVRERSRVEPNDRELKVWEVNFQAAADVWPECAEYLSELFR